jgi:glycosyltransferase involved in cell wall biosynthesis
MSLKVLFLGVYRDGTGWAQGAINHILALDTVDVDVSCRPIKLNRTNGFIPNRVRELEQKNCKNPDVVIQNVLPHMMDYNDKIKCNIGHYYTETSNFTYSGWSDHINTMNVAWVANQQSRNASRSSDVQIPIDVVPCATDIKKFQCQYESLNLRKEIGENFIFYTVGETIRRKNLTALVKAFHLEFHAEEPVELLIKTTPSVVSQVEELNKFCAEIKNNLRLYPDISYYKQEIIIVDYWSEETLMRLHNTCDCFVSPSYGEGWSLPAMDAIGFGKTPIVTDCTGFREYINNDNGWLIPAKLEPVFGATTAIPLTQTGREQWYQIDINELQKAMREVYTNQKLRKEKASLGMKTVYDFSHEKVGNHMKKLLENYINV